MRADLELRNCRGRGEHRPRPDDLETARFALLSHLDAGVGYEQRATARDRIGIGIDPYVDRAVALSLRSRGDGKPSSSRRDRPLTFPGDGHGDCGGTACGTEGAG